MSRIATGTANCRDLIALRSSIAGLPDLKEDLCLSEEPLLRELSEEIDDFRALSSTLERAITDEPPFTVREGGMIRQGYSEELDSIISSVADKTEWIAALKAEEKEKTGIRTLKLGFNKVFGYYIEVSKALADQVPPHYIRKQTLVNAERYITAELKEAESVVLNAREKINALEYRLFKEICAEIVKLTAMIQESSAAIAAVDVLVSFAESSVKNDYCKPHMTDGDRIVIRKGRHPVIESLMSGGLFVSNDVYINKSDASMLLITGPNMSGKSTYMRQLALIVLMAQAGCFVPAEAAEIGICDRIYTRIGASDNFAMGQSTF